MKTQSRSKNPNIKQASLEKLEQRESWHKLAVKVIVWKEGSSSKGLIEAIDKISSIEWDTYCKGMVKINVTNGKDKVMASLKDTWHKIKQNDGFSD